MDSKKPNPFGELLKKLVFEDAEAETENETEEILHTGTEAEFEFGAENNEPAPELQESDDITFSESVSGKAEEAGDLTEDVPDFLKEFEKEAEELAKKDLSSLSEENGPAASADVPDDADSETEKISGTDSDGEEPENTSEETAEPIIPDTEDEISETPSGEESETADEETKDEKKPIFFSGPVSDDSPPSAFRDPDDEIFRNKRQSFSYRSTAKTEDRSGPAIRNPEDNIRYVRKESRKLNRPAEPEYEPKKKHLSDRNETKSDIAALETGKTKPQLSEDADQKTGIFSKLKEELFGSRSVSERKQKINVKSVPEVDYFSIDVDINEEQDDGSYEKPQGFFRKINRSFERSAENSLDDYNEPSDASLILEDLYSLKSNLTIKFGIQMVTMLLSIYLSASQLYHIPVPSFISSSVSPHRYSFTMFLISAVAMFSSFPMITSGLKNLFKKKADCDSLAAVSITVSTIAAAISTESPELISSGTVCLFAPAAITAFLANTMGKHLIVNRAINNFDTLITSHEDNYSLIYVDDETKAEQITKGTINEYPILAATRKTNFSGSFLRYSYSADIADKVCRKFVPASLFISVLFTFAAVIVCSRTMTTLNITFITSMFSLFMSLCSAFAVPLIVNMPLAAAAAEVEDNESMILGYQSIDDFYDTNSVLLDTAQIFPDSSLKLCSIRMCSDTKIDDAIVAAASLVIKSESIFTAMFDEIINHDRSLLDKVENFSSEDTLGVCGWISNKRVLLGTRQLMVNHNIEGLPAKSKDQDDIMNGRIPLYLSVSGNLAAVFTVVLTADKTVSEYLAELIGNGISIIVRNNDCAVTAPRISKLFGIPAEMVKIVPAEHREFCDKITAPVEKSNASVICSGKLSSITKVLSNIRHIHHSSLTGLVLQSTSIVLALIFAVVFMIIGILGQITPLMVILYHTIWAFLTLFIMKVKPR